MTDQRANLLSAATTLDDLLARVTAAAEHLDEQGQDGIAADLFEVERALRNANRRLARVLAALR